MRLLHAQLFCMLQIKVFKLPEQEAEANAFLAVTKPDGVNYNDTGSFFKRSVLMTVSYDDGHYPNEYAVVELRNLIQAAGAAKTQQQVAVGVLEMEIRNLEHEIEVKGNVIATLQEELQNLDKYKEKATYNEKNFRFEKASNELKSLTASLSEKNASREAVLTSMAGQDAKMAVVRDLINELEA